MISFEFATASRILFGPGRLGEVGPLARELGDRALVVTGGSASALIRVQPLLATLADAGVEHTTFTVAGEPTVEIARAGTDCARAARGDMVIGFGGGSVLDAGKAIAALLANGGDPLDYLEVVGRGQPLRRPAAPCIAIPTTAGTGAEVTRNAVLGVPEHRVKVSLRSPWLLPRLAVVDPVLTHGLPPELTASTGLDALTQLIEPFVSSRANPLTDAICREGLHRAARSLRRCYAHGDDASAREDLALASLCGGLALANAGLGAVHGFAAPLGGMFAAPHGALCAALLPHVMAANLQALTAPPGGGAARDRFHELARILTGNDQAAPADGVTWVGDLCRALNVRPLRDYGVTPDHFPLLIEKAAAASSMRGNPVPLSAGQLRDILTRSL